MAYIANYILHSDNSGIDYTDARQREKTIAPVLVANFCTFVGSKTIPYLPS